MLTKLKTYLFGDLVNHFQAATKNLQSVHYITIIKNLILLQLTQIKLSILFINSSMAQGYLQYPESPLILPQSRMSKQLKIPIKINQGRFPIDFFTSRSSRSKSKRVNDPLINEEENRDETPKFSSDKKIANMNLKIQQFLTNKDINEIYNPQIKTSRDHRIHKFKKNEIEPKMSERRFTAADIRHHNKDEKMFKCLNEIIQMTSSIKKVYHKHSMQLIKENLDGKFRKRSILSNNLVLPPILKQEKE